MNNNNQHWSCTLDPALALSPFGVLLVEKLGKEIEIWLGREFWNILNNIDFYLQQPELVIPKRITSRKIDEGRPVLEETLLSLRAWERLRRKTDLAGLNLFWLGDSLKESFLPKSRTLEIFGRWEFLAHLLESSSEALESPDSVLSLAFRDTTALAASLGSAFILTYQLPVDLVNNVPPDICQALEDLGIPCQALMPIDPIVMRERNYLRQLMIRAGMAKLLWADLHLAVLHLVVPTAYTFYTVAEDNSYLKDAETDRYFMENLRGFWYRI